MSITLYFYLLHQLEVLNNAKFSNVIRIFDKYNCEEKFQALFEIDLFTMTMTINHDYIQNNKYLIKKNTNNISIFKKRMSCKQNILE